MQVSQSFGVRGRDVPESVVGARFARETEEDPVTLWVVDIADCVMRQASLTPHSFLNVHIRYSVEKSKEGQKLGVALPGLEAYDVAAETLADDLGVRKVFLQTASPVALERFVQFAMTLAMTNGPTQA